MGQQIGDCGILVLSSDHYRDLWGIFFSEFQRRWPCCSYPVYLGSNTYSESGVKNVTVILSGEDHDWSTSFQKILEQIEETYLLVLLEDLILVEDVDEETIQNEFQLMKEKHLLSLENFPANDLETIINTSFSFKEILERPIKKVPSLQGKTIVNLFFENSTRTRIIF